jgi:class 3 adenylate cyclase
MRPFWRSCAIGLAVSALMFTLYVMDPTGLTEKFESISLDLRFTYANRLVSPSDQVRIVAIDDQTLLQLEREYGRYPWPRRVFADIVDVLKEAGAKRIALDLHFPEAQRFVLLPEGSPQLQEPEIQDDERFAAAIARVGNVYLPIVFDVMPGQYDMTRIDRIAREIAKSGQALDDEQYSRLVGLPLPLLEPNADLRGRMADQLRERFWLNDASLAEALQVDLSVVRKWVGPVKRRVALELVRRAAADPQATVDSICRGLDRNAPPTARANREEIAWALDLVRIEQLIWPDLPAAPQADVPSLTQVRNPLQMQLPIAPLAGAAHGFGHVQFDPDADGSVRRLAMLVRWNDRVVPQMGLRVATDMLNLQWDEARVTPEKITVPGRTRVGQPTLYTLPLDESGRTLVNWTSTGETWESTFAPVPAGEVLEVAQLRQAMHRNEAWLQTRLLALVQKLQPAELARYKQLVDREQEVARQARQSSPASQRKPIPKSLPDQWEQIRMEQKKIEIACVDWLRMNRQDLPASLEACTDPEEREYLSLYEDFADDALATRIAETNATLAVRVDERLARLRSELGDKVVFVGCTAVALADIVSTPVWKQSPGVMTHAQVLSAMLQNASIRPLDHQTNAAIVLACCLAMALVAAWLGPQASLATMVAGCLAFAAFSMYGLFERLGIATALATPIVGMFVTWAMITAYRQLVEERAKRHMTRTLQQYTSPALARRMAEDPNTVMRAESREVTCFFSDLKGFTGISEQLGAEATQQVLNFYLERMTEAMDHREALVNKFLGDGIFAFFNPAINPQTDHAERGCLAALDAVAALERLKADPQAAPACQHLHMRIGLASGMAVVGNCGSERKFDYTCIGDTVNLASRLEGANKTFGTGILINARCKDLLGGELACRFLGRVIVTGRAAYEEVYELVGRREQVGDARLARIERFEQAVRCYIAGNLSRAKEGFEGCLREDGSDSAARFYIDVCTKQMQGPLPDGWTGAVEMVGK